MTEFTQWIYFILVLAFLSGCQQSDVTPGIQVLADNWYLQSAEKLQVDGKTLSMAFDSRDWYKTRVPSTVMAALVNNEEYKDIYFDKNLESIPTERFQCAWWYRTEFDIADIEAMPYASLIFDGLNYSANIWFNGVQIGTVNEITGVYRQFNLDISPLIRAGKNFLAVEVFPPKPGDFIIGFVDWNPKPPDQNMGIWREVKLVRTRGVSIDHPFVMTDLEPDHKKAGITVRTGLINHQDKEISGELTGRIGDRSFSKSFSVKAKETAEIEVGPDDFAGLMIDDPQLWWPNNFGDPNLYDLHLSVTVDGRTSDQRNVRFGIRTVEDYINEAGHRGYKVNGKKILIRGGGWVDNLLLADDEQKIEAQIKYVKHMNLNTIRLEGFWGSSEKLYDLADQYGILIMPGWSCQWEWEGYLGKATDEFGGVKTEADMELINRSLEDQVKWLRNHPSIFVWVLGSDMLPRPALEKKYASMLAETDPTRPALAACGLYDSEVSGPTAVKMNGPYEYVTPNYWYVDKGKGGAYGFNTETGPGAQPPPLESLKKMIPADKLWPVNDIWNYHCGRNEFGSLDRYMKGMESRYWKAQSVEEFAMLAQVVNYEGMRAMFEAFSVNKPVSTGIIQWMLNSAWPELFWQLYDYYLMPNGAFYGAKTGSQPLNIAYNYGDKNIYLVNDTYQKYENLTAQITVLDINSKIVYQEQVPAAIMTYESKKIHDLPAFGDLSTTYFLSLRIVDENANPVARNFYWLSTKEDVIDFSDDTWFVTRNKSYADLSALRTLPKVKLDVDYEVKNTGNEQTMMAKLTNNTAHIAFCVELNVYDTNSGASILPVFWNDNYISVLPGETVTVDARYASVQPGGLRINGLNLSQNN